MEAEIISIGTELLLGEIVDTNTRKIALVLRQLGVDLFRTSTVGDNAERIADAIRSGVERADVVITTGGIGPTVDDATREGVAKAFDLPNEFNGELWGQVKTRIESFGRKPTENNRRQAFIPKGARGIENPVGTAPGFILEQDDSCVISLPGVPAEMEYLLHNEVLPYLKNKYKLTGLIKSKRIRTAGIGESALAAKLGDLEHLSNPTVGFSAHPGRVDVRITAKAASEHEADEMIWKVQATIEQRIGDLIYGYDDDTLEKVVLAMIAERGQRLYVFEQGTGGAITQALSIQDETFAGGQVLQRPSDGDETSEIFHRAFNSIEAKVKLGSAIHHAEAQVQHTILIQLPEENFESVRSYPSSFANLEERAASISLNVLRKVLIAS